MFSDADATALLPCTGGEHITQRVGSFVPWVKSEVKIIMTTPRENERSQETAEEQTVAQASADEALTAEELAKVVGGDGDPPPNSQPAQSEDTDIWVGV